MFKMLLKDILFCSSIVLMYNSLKISLILKLLYIHELHFCLGGLVNKRISELNVRMRLVTFINHTILPSVIFHMIPDKIHINFNHMKRIPFLISYTAFYYTSTICQLLKLSKQNRTLPRLSNHCDVYYFIYYGIP